MRVAAIDIGTNTVLLLVAERGDDGEVLPVVDRAEITRLGQGVDRTRKLAPDAIERTLSCLRGYAAEIGRLGVAALDVVGTSAMRDAAPAGVAGGDFIARAAEILGKAPRVISGEEEASLSFSGGLLGLGLSGPVTAFDIGGGSTEVMFGVAGPGETKVGARKSFDIGSVRLYERHVRHDPPSAEELQQIESAAIAELATLPAPPQEHPLVGMAGTVTTIAAIAREIEPYDPSKIHGLRLSASEIDETVAELARMPLDQRRNTRGLEPNRADVIPVGGTIVRAVMNWSGIEELVISDRGLRWGLALRLLVQGSRES